MHTQVATEASRPRTRRSARSLLVLSIGPMTAVAGVVWAILQPYRITLLDPHGQGFWWLFSEPPLYVILVGLLFHLLVAPGVVADLEDTRPRVPREQRANGGSEWRTPDTAERRERRRRPRGRLLPRAASGGGEAGLRSARANAVHRQET